MKHFGGLVRVFVRDLVRRRMLWLLVVVTVGIVAVNYGALRTMEDAMGNGESWDVATRRAASGLDRLAGTMRGWLSVVTILLAAQVAPESRRNGTTQFMLSLGVRRNTLAGAQFTALGLFLLAGTLIVHAGFAVAGLRTGAVTWHEVALAWVGFLLALLALAAAVFAISLTASTLETYLVFIGIPFITRTLPALAHGFPRHAPLALVRSLDNLSLFFPELDELISWPHLSFGTVNGAPHPEWRWALAHMLVALAFWAVLGVWLQRHHDFGSRTAVK